MVPFLSWNSPPLIRKAGPAQVCTISSAMLLPIQLNVGLDDVSDVLVDLECPSSSQLD